MPPSSRLHSFPSNCETVSDRQSESDWLIFPAECHSHTYDHRDANNFPTNALDTLIVSSLEHTPSCLLHGNRTRAQHTLYSRVTGLATPLRPHRVRDTFTACSTGPIPFSNSVQPSGIQCLNSPNAQATANSPIQLTSGHAPTDQSTTGFTDSGIHPFVYARTQHNPTATSTSSVMHALQDTES